MPASWSFEAIGAPWQVITERPVTPVTRAAIAARIDDFDRVYSTYRDDSLVAELARSGGPIDFPLTALALLELYRELDAVTAGAVSPGRVEARRAGDVAVLRAPHKTATGTTALPLDVGAAGKGLLVDEVVAWLADAGHHGVTVDASGDIRTTRLDRVGLADPRDPRLAIGTVEFAGAALASSAITRSGAVHVRDAKTGEPPRDVIATWAIAPTAMLADGLATALFFAGGAALAGCFGAFDYVRMLADHTVERSATWPGEIFT